MPPGTDQASWYAGFGEAIKRVGVGRGIEARRGVQAGRACRVVQGGHVQDDPPGFFLLGHDGYSDMGRHMAGPGLPSVVVMEGGYAVDDLGINSGNLSRRLRRGRLAGMLARSTLGVQSMESKSNLTLISIAVQKIILDYELSVLTSYFATHRFSTSESSLSRVLLFSKYSEYDS